MNFRDLLKKIPYLHVKFNHGTARVISVDWETEKVSILLDEGTKFTLVSEYTGHATTLISDGWDKVNVSIQDLERQN